MASDFGVLLPANTTNNAAPTLADLLADEASEQDTPPGLTGVLASGEGDPPTDTLVLCPYGKAAGGTATVYVVGWAKVRRGGSTLMQWHPQLLSQFDATLSTSLVGVASGLVLATEFYADVVADPVAGAGVINVDCWKKAPGTNKAAAQMEVFAGDYRRVQVVLKRNTATELNCLYRWISRLR